MRTDSTLCTRWTNVLSHFLVCTVVCLALVAISGPQVFAQPLADYGDAPDGQNAHYAIPYADITGNFPTSYATSNSRYGLPGAHTLDITDSWLGSEVSLEFGSSDPADPDGIENFIDDDFDDGLVGWPCPSGTLLVPWPTMIPVTMSFDVTVAAIAPDLTRYINILVDFDNNGEWNDVGFGLEWVVQDLPVEVTPGTTQTVVIGPFYLPVTAVAKWTRVALTRTEVDGTFTDDGSGWDGGGAFSHGEIEDFLMIDVLAFAEAAADAGDAADQSAADADSDKQHVLALESAIELIDLSEQVSATAAAFASATAYAYAAVEAEAEASASVEITVEATAQADAYASAVATTCVSCPCATVCGAATASAESAAEACATAEVMAEAEATAAASAVADAQGHATAAANAQAEVSLQVSAVASALAQAESRASAVANASAEASSWAVTASGAYATALAAVCGGNAQAAATAVAAAWAAAGAAADAAASASVEVYAMADVQVDAHVAVERAIAVQTSAVASASAAAFASARAEANATAAASAAITAESIVTCTAEAGILLTATCNHECCDDPGTGILDPVYVDLASFDVASHGDEVVVSWSTDREVNITGFDVLRAEQGTDIYEKINEVLIQSKTGSGVEYEFVDSTTTPGLTYVYRLEAVEESGEAHVIDSRTLTVAQVLPQQLKLHIAHPNPSNPSTTIRFELPEATHVRLSVHDVMGRVVRTLIDTGLQQDFHSVVWDGRDDSGQSVASGVYVYRLTAGKETLTKKMLVSK